MATQYKTKLLATLERRPHPQLETVFVAPDIARRSDVHERKDRLARMVGAAIVPRLLSLHHHIQPPPLSELPSEAEITELAHLVLGPDIEAAIAYVTVLRERGLSMEMLFVQLLQPAAQHLGKMWDNDECDFIDVTLGVGQLQLLMATFNCTHVLPTFGEKRRAFLTATPGEQHSFGLGMVANLLSAAGWWVTTNREANLDEIARATSSDWYAVAGLTLGSDRYLPRSAEAIAAIRKNSRNPAIGIMVGGQQFIEQPELVARLGADATASDAISAVILAQKLFDVGAKSNWMNTASE